MRRRLVTFLIVLCSLQAANNLLPYVGLRDDSCQTMFCGLEWWPRRNNHFFVPQRMVGDLWAYHTDVHAELIPPPEGPGRAQYLSDWLGQEDRALNTEATRAVIAQLCARGHAVRMSYVEAVSGDRREVDDACEVPSLSEPSWWIPVRLYETDFPTGPSE